jgi:hypothetical protein
VSNPKLLSPIKDSPESLRRIRLYLGSILSVYKSAAKIKEVGSLSAELLDIAMGFYEIMVSIG